MAINYSEKTKFNEEFPKRDLAENWQYYKEVIRPNLRTGDIVFGSGRAWDSKLIQWRSKSIWSHSGIIVKIEEIDSVFILESIAKMGVRLIPLSKVLYDYAGNHKPYHGRVFLARHEDVTPSTAKTITTYGMSLLTSQYDNIEYLKIIWRIIMGKGLLNANRQYMCSELVHDCFLEAGIQLKYAHGLFIAPGALASNNKVHFTYQMI